MQLFRIKWTKNILYYGKKQMNILLIGNSLSATAMEMGEDIDNFNGVVARFNSYKTDGYEKYVGSRTDIWITCGVFRNNMKKEYKDVLLISTLLNEQEDKNFNVIKDVYNNIERVRYETVYATKQIMGYNIPSSGAIALVHYMSKGYNVTLYGFNFMVDNQKHHYSDNTPKGDYHKSDKEMLFFNKYLLSKKIKFLGWNDKRQSVPIVRTPAVCGEKSLSQHRGANQLGWYNWIARECMNSTVLDVGCGIGEGLKLLSQSPCSYVTGVDIDDNLKGVINNYICGIENIPYGTKYDLVVSVDVIEHIIDDITFLNKLKSLAKRKLYVTTPNFSRSYARNIAHCRELTISQFINIYEPDELWVASPDGWFNLTCLIKGNKGKQYPLDKTWNDYSVDGKEWAHMCGVWNK